MKRRAGESPEDVPRGTVTFLFTDVERSTRLWEEHPEAMATALAAHDEAVHSAITASDGYVFSTAGDAFAAAFWTPGAAVAAAVAAQRALAVERWPRGMSLRVRMGLHTGVAHERDGDYFGAALNRAARLMAAAHGGQIVMSLATEELVRDQLPPDVRLVDLGAHPLRDLSRPEHVFEVSAAGLEMLFPPLRSQSVAVGNLPQPPTTFVGRGEEVRRLVSEWPAARLITLTGAGGVGKTRLAVEAAWLAADRFPDGAWFCELAPVADGEAVPHVVGATLLVRPQDGLSMADSVVDALRGRDLLVILDNCEHLLDATADLAARISASCQTVSLLMTSREPVGIRGERVWIVRPLLPEVEGTELFRDRAMAADTAFHEEPGDQVAIAAICERLDGIPLAIELAAARVRSMTPADLAERLHDRFRLLRTGPRGDIVRHQTLQAAVQWSYDLLAEDERVLFARLAVFAGGFDLPAAEAVCADERVDPADVGDLVASLVDKSMIVADRTGRHVRFGLLETLRQYAEDRLRDADLLSSTRDAHLAHCVRVAERARADYEGGAHEQGAATFRSEWDNFRSAIRHAIDRHHGEQGRRLVRALFFFSWFDVRHELGEWAEQLMAVEPADPVIRGVAAFFAVQRGARDEGLRLAEEDLALAGRKRSADAWISAYAATFAYWYSGRVSEGWSADQTLYELVDAEADPFAAANTAAIVASHACYADPLAATEYLSRAREIGARLGNPAIESMVDWVTGMVSRTQGDVGVALLHLHRALATAERTDNRVLAGLARLSLAITATVTNAPHVEEALRESLVDLYAIRDWHAWLIVEATALHWAAGGRMEEAAILLGHLEKRDVRHGGLSRRRQEVLDVLHALPEAPSWMERGARLDRDELVRYALEQLCEESS